MLDLPFTLTFYWHWLSAVFAKNAWTNNGDCLKQKRLFLIDFFSRKCLWWHMIIVTTCSVCFFCFINKMSLLISLHTWVGYWYVCKNIWYNVRFTLSIRLYMYNVIVISIWCKRLQRILDKSSSLSLSLSSLSLSISLSVYID